MYQSKIDILLFSKYPEIGTQFVEQFLETTGKFENLRLHYVSDGHTRITTSHKVVYHDTKLYGSVFAAPFLEKLLEEKSQYFGWFNDDVWIVEGWLEDMMEKFALGYQFVCPGVADTDIKEHFLEAVEKTKNEMGVDDYLAMPAWMIDCRVFRTMGTIDDRFQGAVDDMDILWRLHLNKIRSCSSKKITMGHWVGTSTYRGDKIDDKALKDWYVRADKMRTLFHKKHGYEAYHHIALQMKRSYLKYFKQFRFLKREQNAS